MKKIIFFVLFALIVMTPIRSKASLADELDETDCYESITTKRDTGSWIENSDCRWVANFFARNVSAKANTDYVLLNMVATTSAKGFVVQVSPSEGFNRKVKQYYFGNAQYAGPVVCRDLFQIRLKGKYSSWIQHTATLGNKVLYTAKKFHPNDLDACNALVYNNAVMNRIRQKINIKRSYKLLGVTNGSKCYVRVRCVYQSFHKTVYSRWVTVKVR